MEQTKLNEEAVNAFYEAYWPEMSRKVNGDIIEGVKQQAQDALHAYLSHPSALRSIIEQSVKPLEWEEQAHETVKEAKTALNTYQIVQSMTCLTLFLDGVQTHDTAGYSQWAEMKTACLKHHAEQVLKLFNLGGEEVDSREHSNQTK